jgi:hypothetical protein
VNNEQRSQRQETIDRNKDHKLADKNPVGSHRFLAACARSQARIHQGVQMAGANVMFELAKSINAKRPERSLFLSAN